MTADIRKLTRLGTAALIALAVAVGGLPAAEAQAYHPVQTCGGLSDPCKMK